MVTSLVSQSSDMSKKCHVLPTSSTPHQSRHRMVLANFFEDDFPSPIMQPVIPKDGIKKLLKPVRSANDVGTAKTRVHSRKQVPKDKESTSNAVLNELGSTRDNLRNNALSQSRNLYYNFPEPIVLDSDEEEKLFTLSSRKKTPEKKRPRRCARVKKVDSKTNVEPTESKPCHSDVDNKCKVSKQPPVKPAVKRTNEVLPMSNLANTLSTSGQTIQLKKTDNVKKNESKFIAEKASTPSIVMLEEDSLIPYQKLPKHIINSQKLQLNKISLKEAIDLKDTITWTPRRLKNKVDSPPSAEDIDENQNPALDKGENVKVKSNNIVCDKPRATRKRKDNPSSDAQPEAPVKKTQLVENNLPAEYFSRFQDVVFKHNKYCGGIIARCLKTEVNKFGYVEVDKGKTFIGEESKITFVLLEGQVEAFYKNTKQTLSCGDIIHMGEESEYKFKNNGPTHARFLYVKELP